MLRKLDVLMEAILIDDLEDLASAHGDHLLGGRETAVISHDPADQSCSQKHVRPLDLGQAAQGEVGCGVQQVGEVFAEIRGVAARHQGVPGRDVEVGAGGAQQVLGGTKDAAVNAGAWPLKLALVTLSSPPAVLMMASATG